MTGLKKCYDNFGRKEFFKNLFLQKFYDLIRQKPKRLNSQISLMLFFYVIIRLKQRCPTLSPFATCGDRSLKCGDKKLFQMLFALEKPNTKLMYRLFLLTVATATTLSPQMWRNEQFGWTTLT